MLLCQPLLRRYPVGGLQPFVNLYRVWYALTHHHPHWAHQLKERFVGYPLELLGQRLRLI